MVIPLAKNNPLEGSWSPLPERPGSWPWGLSYTAHVSPHRRGTGQPGRAGGTARDGCEGVRRCQNWVLSTGCLLAERSPPHPPPSRLFAGGVRGEGRRLEFFRRWGWVGSGGSGIGGSLQDDGLMGSVGEWLEIPCPSGRAPAIASPRRVGRGRPPSPHGSSRISRAQCPEGAGRGRIPQPTPPPPPAPRPATPPPRVPSASAAGQRGLRGTVTGQRAPLNLPYGKPWPSKV